MAEYTDDLALIVRYDGTKEDFDDDKSNYLGKVVFIYGSKTEVANQAGLVQAIWVSDANGGRYLDMANVEYISNNLTHISGITVDGTTYYPSKGGGAITLAGANGITVTVNTTTGAVTFDGETLKSSLIGTTSNNSNTTTYPDTIKGAKAYTDKVAGDLKGTKADGDTTAVTIRGAKDYADAKVSDAKTELKGTKAVGDTTAETIRGAKDYASNVAAKIVSNGNDAATDDTIKGAKLYTDAAKEDLLGKSGDAPTQNTIYGAKAYADTKDITIDSTNTDSTLAGKFVIKKNGVALATINIPKELVVTKDGSEIVKGTWSGDTFTESETGTGKALKLAIQNQTTPIYINVADLVDVYTAAQGATEVQLTISENNVISATITAVSGTKIIPNTIDKDKLTDAVKESLNNADSAYQLPEGGIPKNDLAQEVKNSLDNAVMEVSAQPSDTDYLTINVSKSGTTRTISYDVKTDNTIDAAINDATKKGLATVEDVAAYLKARLAVKVVS